VSVHQVKDGRWFVRYPKGKNKAEPNRTREYFGRGPDAERQARERNHELGLGTPAKDRSPLFIDFVQAYLEAKDPCMMAQASKIALKTKLTGIILPMIG